MAAHMLVLIKLRLATGHSNWKLLAALLCPFALKLPFALQMPSSTSDMALSVRFFLFRLNRIFFYGDDEAPLDQRWERALRLFWERAAVSLEANHHVAFNDVSLNIAL